MLTKRNKFILTFKKYIVAMGLLTRIFIYSLPSENVTITIWTWKKKDKVQMLILAFLFLWRSLPKDKK